MMLFSLGLIAYNICMSIRCVKARNVVTWHFNLFTVVSIRWMLAHAVGLNWYEVYPQCDSAQFSWVYKI